MLTLPSLPILLGAMVLAGPALMAWIISLQTIGQKETEDAFRGRVFGMLGMITTFIMFFGSAIAGFMADQIGTFILIAAAAGIYLLAGVISPLVFGPVRQAAPSKVAQ